MKLTALWVESCHYTVFFFIHSPCMKESVLNTEVLKCFFFFFFKSIDHLIELFCELQQPLVMYSLDKQLSLTDVPCIDFHFTITNWLIPADQ